MIKICRRCKEERNIKDFYLSHGYIQQICKFCSLQKSKEWRNKNYNRVLESNKLWKRENNPRKTKKRWGIITYTKEDQRRAWKKYTRTSKGIYGGLKTSCKQKKNNRLKISQQDFINWYEKELKVCHYCSITLEEWLLQVGGRSNWYKRLTIDRKDNNKDYELGNLVLCCYNCNTVKADIFTEQEMLEIGKIIKRKRIL